MASPSSQKRSTTPTQSRISGAAFTAHTALSRAAILRSTPFNGVRVPAAGCGTALAATNASWSAG